MALEPLEIRLLGEFALVRNGVELPAPIGKKARVLVARLALSPGHKFLREDLSAHLWPDSDPETARYNLRQLLNRIRRSAPALSASLVGEDHSTLRFDGATAKTDVSEFERLGEVQAEQAVDLYGGPLLEGIDDEWINARRISLEDRYLGLLESLADRSPPLKAVHWLRRAVETDPYREPLQQKLLMRLAECGDVAGVQVALRRFQLLLHRSINASPSPETMRLYKELVSGRNIEERPRIEPALRSRLPIPGERILGREQLCNEVSEQLRRHRLITLVGPGGVGKTRLAIEIAAREVDRRAAGVWFVDFSAESEPAQVPQAIGQAIGLREQSGMAWTEAIAEHISESDHLLIFDNCEHLLDACSLAAAALLSRCRHLTLLATSRAPLAASGELRIAVPPLDLPELPPDSPEQYLAFSAIGLFAERARLVSPGFKLNATNASTVADICREVDGIPLGIEMAAARLSALSLDEVARRLDDKLGFLRAPGRARTPRHTSLAAVISWSYELLDAADKTLLRRLGVFAGGWTLDSAVSVCAYGVLDEVQVVEGLLRLSEASLVQHREGRYYFLDTIRAFARQGLDDDPGADEVRACHFRLLSEFCEDPSAIVDTDGPDQAAAHYRGELENIRSALSWALSKGASDDRFQFAADACLVLSIAQLDREAALWLDRFLALETAEPSRMARLLVLKTACTVYQSRFLDHDRALARRKATSAANELAGYAEELGRDTLLAHALCEIGRANLTEDRALAENSFRRALEIYRSQEVDSDSQRPLILLGQSAANGGRYEEARRLLREAQLQAESVGDVATQIFALQTKSHLLREQGLYSEALARLRKIERILRSWPDARSAVVKDLRLAELYLDTWQFEYIAEPLGRARAAFEESRSRLIGLLLDALTRYVAAYECRIEEASSGISVATASLIKGASSSLGGWWHGASIELEALALCLSRIDLVSEGARVFGAAQSLRARDYAHLSPNLYARWAHLTEEGGFEQFSEEIAAGRAMSPDETQELVEELEFGVLANWKAAEVPGAKEGTPTGSIPHPEK